jgi:hypothetical protein
MIRITRSLKSERETPVWSPLYPVKSEAYTTDVVYPGCKGSRTPESLCLNTYRNVNLQNVSHHQETRNGKREWKEGGVE